jgi:hypothetical protein
MQQCAKMASGVRAVFAGDHLVIRHEAEGLQEPLGAPLGALLTLRDGFLETGIRHVHPP